MSSKKIRLILVLMLVTIGGLFITQAYWFKKAFTIQERQFDEKINIALRSAANQLLLLNNDSSSRILPISKLSSNEYVVHTNSYFRLKDLDSCLRSEFIQREIDIEFDYYILNLEEDEIVLGNTIFDVFIDSTIACKTRNDNKDNLDFKIRVHSKTTYLLNSMGIWMYSSISLLAILAVFTFIIVSIIKGKKLAVLKKDFVNNMTHELKTPIANISVASDAIRNKSVKMDEVKLEQYANIIYNENERLHNLVDRVLQISDIEKNEESLAIKDVDIHEVISKVTHSFEPLIQQRNGRINEELNASDSIIRADNVHLTNVIYNLIENAIKYSDTNPEITVSTSSNKEGLTMEIADKGVGISKENQHRIFDNFFRAESGNLHNTKGYGLGLSYVKLIVEKHEGSVTFKSVENEGSTFSIFLPK